MKSIFFCLRIILCMSMWLPTSISATRFIQGNGTFPQSFNQFVASKTFNPATGTLYLGLASGGGTYAVSAVAPNFEAGTLFATPLATNTLRTNKDVGFLSLANNIGEITAPLTGSGILGSANNKTVFVLSTVNPATLTFNSPTLLDAGGAVNSDGNPTNGVIGLSSNHDFIFAAVRPSGSTFGQPNSGIAVVRINRDNTTAQDPLSGLVQTAAVAGDAGIKAKRLDASTIEVFDPANTGSISEPTQNVPSPNVPLYWDNVLQRLYIGLQVTSGDTTGDVARSIVVAQILPTGVLTLYPIAASTAITPNTAATQNEVVAGKLSEDGTSFDLTALKVAVMHTSTGPSYLIVNGGNGTTSTSNVGAKIFALPLVDKSEADGDIDPAFDAIHGTLANINAPLVDFKFVQEATAPGDLAKDPTLTASGNIFALVGGTPLPLFEAGSTFTNTISDMIVVGDAVYVAINIPQSTTNETGILSSQAKFGPDGKIVGWTPWAKRAFPYDGLPSPMNPGTAKFVSVDAANGNVWAVGGDNDQTVAVTTWDQGTRPTGLITVLNTLLKQGSYSVLDLDAYTNGFDGNTASRYALFGGVGKVVFARISESLVGNSSYAPQMVIEDFSEPENILNTPLLNNAGAVTVLEYSRNRLSDINYFFAGTQQGLYVFSDGGHGFSASTLTTLDMPPFSNGAWSKVSTIPGSVVDIKTLGNSLYVLTFTTSKSIPMSSILYSIPFAATTTAMFSPANIRILAQSGLGIFSATRLFSSIQLIGTNTTSTTEQLVLTTNQGVYRSSTVGGVQTATNQTAAAWKLVPTSESTFYTKDAGMDPSFVTIPGGTGLNTGNPTTVWPVSIDDLCGLRTFKGSSIHQLNGTTDTGPFAFVPINFNSIVPTPSFFTFPPITYFFSDGARRFFIVQRGGSLGLGNAITVWPYDVLTTRVANPIQDILSVPALTPPCFYSNWIKEIGMSGIVAVGTSSGVLGLE